MTVKQLIEILNCCESSMTVLSVQNILCIMRISNELSYHQHSFTNNRATNDDGVMNTTSFMSSNSSFSINRAEDGGVVRTLSK